MTRQVSWVCAISTQEEKKAELFKTIKENKFAHFINLDKDFQLESFYSPKDNIIFTFSNTKQ